jgi:arabinogalactan endo-1,4-beta-galactosidase
MKKLTYFLLFCLFPCCLQAQEKFALGADISGTTALEARGEKLYDKSGNISENTAIMKQCGLNAVRLRVWVNPRDGFSDAQDVLEMAKRAKYYDMDVMIDFHYSDWWADPGKQTIPGIWQYLSYGEMKDKLGEYTKSVLQLLKDNQIEVKWIQIGNETTHGFLWPMGRAEDNMEHYAGLTEAGYEAAKSVYPNAMCIVHLDGGCDSKRYDFIFDGLKRYGAHWDMIGMSVYPYWDMEAKLTKSEDETLAKVMENIQHLYKKYGSESMIVETGVDVRKPLEGKKFLEKLIKASKTQTDGHCHGVFYWAPELEDGAYWLGAFKNHRPTEIMDAFKEAR